jgi:hypothetical protein
MMLLLRGYASAYRGATMERARRAASNRAHSTFPLSASSCRSEWLSAALRYIASDEFSRLFTKMHGDAGRLFDDAARRRWP